MHHLSYGNWWVFICSLFGWYSFYSRQNKLLDIEKNWGYIDILLSIFPLYFFPQIYTSLWRTRPTFDGKLYKYPCHLPSGWVWPVGGTGSMAEGCRRVRLKYLMPSHFFEVDTDWLHLAIQCIDYWCPMRPWKKKKKTLWANLRLLDLLKERQIPPLKVIESQMRKSGQYVTGF